ncbi:hypothetical protein Golax_014762, partial [Gossypium laxum]|nr:hypothetical protein [Gossypium laxum]
MERDEISLLEEELIQLSVKSLLVVTNGKPTLCIVWTKKSYNPDSFRAQLKVFGRLRRNLRYRLLESMERSTIRLVASPFWVKVGPCPPKCDRKDLIHAIGSTFGGVLRSKVKGDFCKIKVQMNMGHSIKECIKVTLKVKDLLEDELPYSLALKAELNLLGRESLKLGSVVRKSMKWGAVVEFESDSETIGVRRDFRNGLADKDWPNMKVDEVQSEVIRTMEDSPQNIKKSWQRLIKIIMSRQNQLDGVHGKRKRTWEEFDRKEFFGVRFSFILSGIGGCQETSRPGVMKIIYWNIRGLGIPRAVHHLRLVLKIDIGAKGTKWGLCLAWKEEMSIIWD